MYELTIVKQAEAHRVAHSGKPYRCVIAAPTAGPSTSPSE